MRFGYEQMVRDTVAEIQRRIDNPPDFRQLAANAFLSAYHFHRIFDAMVGESPRELARRLRLERAAHRLRDTDSAILEIAGIKSATRSPLRCTCPNTTVAPRRRCKPICTCRSMP